MAFNWKCPCCEHNSVIDNKNASSDIHAFDFNNYTGERLGVYTRVIVCPNNECKQVALNAKLGAAGYVGGTMQMSGDYINEWDLLPSSSSLIFPAYIPRQILDDYEEACKIKNLSPKASATLSRRCLQGIIRDFWKVSKPRLVEEIEAIRDKVEDDVWATIDAVRKIGNIGAHMEKDINVIIDVDPGEAQLLIGLIEMLITDWYIARHKRKENLRQIVEAAASKK